MLGDRQVSSHEFWTSPEDGRAAETSATESYSFLTKYSVLVTRAKPKQ